MSASATLVANAGDASRPPIAANTKQMDGFMGDGNQKDRDEFQTGDVCPPESRYQDGPPTFTPVIGTVCTDRAKPASSPDSFGWKTPRDHTAIKIINPQ